MGRDYTITQFDSGVMDVAQRFHLHPALIVEMNPDVFPFGGYGTEPFTPAMVGMILKLPDDPDHAKHDWLAYSAVSGETLAVICTKFNKDRRIDPQRKHKGIPTPPWLEGQYVLDLFENAELRAGHGADAATFTLAKGEKVMIPFPRSQSGLQIIAATPNGATTVPVEPMWLRDLKNFIKSLRERTRAFEASCIALRAHKEKGLMEVQLLNAARGVLDLEIGHPSKPKELAREEIGTMRMFGKQLDSLIEAAMDAMYSQVNKHMYPEHLASTMKAGRQILADIRDEKGDRLGTLVKQLKGEATRYPSVTNDISDALSYALLTLADSPLVDEVKPFIEEISKYLAGIRKVDATPIAAADQQLAENIERLPAAGNSTNPVTTIISLLGGGVGSVGNLPGPSTLAVALVRLKAMINGTQNILKSVTQGAVAQLEADAIFIAMASNAVAGSKAEAKEFLSLVGRMRRAALTKALFRPSSTEFALLKEIDAKVSARVMASPKWVAGLGMLNVLAAGLAIYDMIRTGGSGPNASNVMSLLLSGGAAASSLAKLLRFACAEGVGRAVAFVGFAWNAYQTWDAYSQGDSTGGTINLVSTIGAGLLCASLFAGPFGPVLAVTGGILIIGSAVISIIRELSHSDTERWWQGIEAAFEGGEIFKAVKGKDGNLAAKVKSFRHGIGDADFLKIDASQRTALGQLVPKESFPALLVGAT